jgi:Methyltransferase domain
MMTVQIFSLEWPFIFFRIQMTDSAHGVIIKVSTPSQEEGPHVSSESGSTIGLMNNADSLPLPAAAFARQDETPDEAFYAQPRFVTHIDDPAIAAVTQLYREYFPAGGRILDLMSSWVSHLPPEVTYSGVTGLGLNAAELGRNPRLSERVVQNLNTNPRLPFADQSFDAAGITVSVDYLTDPVAVLRDLGRVLVPGGPVVISFSNRCFPSKAVAVWHRLDDAGHLNLVQRYLEAAGNWEETEQLDRSPRTAGKRTGDPLYAVIARATGERSTG